MAEKAITKNNHARSASELSLGSRVFARSNTEKNLNRSPSHVAAGNMAIQRAARECSGSDCCEECSGEKASAGDRSRLGGVSVRSSIRVLPPNSLEEHEAHRVAEQMSLAPAGPSSSGSVASIQRMCDDCETEEEQKSGHMLSAATDTGATPIVTPTVERGVQNLSGRGQGLPPPLRTHFEGRFGRDLLGVRVHHDSHAHQLASAVQARAFTTGSHIVFGSGQFAPQTDVGQRLLAHELTHVVQQGGAPPGQTMQRSPGPDDPQPPAPPPPKPLTPEEEADDYWDQNYEQWSSKIFDSKLSREEQGKAARMVLLMDQQKGFFLDVDDVDDTLEELEGIASDEDYTLSKLGKAASDGMETFPIGFPKAWGKRFREELSLVDMEPSLAAQAHQARDKKDEVALRIKPYILENGLPVEFKLALFMHYFPLLPLHQRGSGHIVNEFAQAAFQYGIAQIPWDFVVRWNAMVGNLANALISGGAEVDFDAYRAFREKMLSRARGIQGDVSTGFSRAAAANEAPSIDFPTLTLGMTLGSFLISVSNVKDNWKESERQWDAELANTDQEIEQLSGPSRYMLGDKWARKQGYSLDAAVKVAEDLAENLPEMAAKTAGFIAVQFVPVLDIIVDVIAFLETAKDLIDLAQEIEEAFDRVMSAEKVVDLQREIAQLELLMASAQLRIALDVAALKATAKGFKEKAARFKGESLAVEKVGVETLAEGEKLKASGSKADGTKLTPDELQTELDVARKTPARRVNQAEYDAEIDIGNNHTWKHERTTGSWCRFSPGPAKCVPSLEGESAAAKPTPIDQPGSSVSLSKDIASLPPPTPKAISAGEMLTVPIKGKSRATVVRADGDVVIIKIKSKSASGDITHTMSRELFDSWSAEGKVIRWSGVREQLMSSRPRHVPDLAEKVWEKAKKPDGKVYDPNTQKELFWDRSKSRRDQWHLGHIKGEEYRKLVDRFCDGEITEDQFFKEYNDVAKYQPEDPAANVSHVYEAD